MAVERLTPTRHFTGDQRVGGLLSFVHWLARKTGTID